MRTAFLCRRAWPARGCAYRSRGRLPSVVRPNIGVTPNEIGPPLHISKLLLIRAQSDGDVGLRKIAAFEQQWFTHSFGKGIGKTVAEI